MVKEREYMTTNYKSALLSDLRVNLKPVAVLQIKLHKPEIKFANKCSPISGSPTPTTADSFRHTILMGCFLSCILSSKNNNTRRRSHGSAFKPRRRRSRLFSARRPKKPAQSSATDSQDPAEPPNNVLSESSPLLRPEQTSPQSRRPAFLTRPLSRGREAPKVRVIPPTPEAEQVLRAAKGKQVASNSKSNGN